VAYRLVFSSRAKRDFGCLAAPQMTNVFTALRRLGDEPRPAGAKRVRGVRGGLRVRVGDHRIIYTVDDDRGVVNVGRIARRDKAYRRLDDLTFD
jgi:mRNA interferase RelE/StbE